MQSGPSDNNHAADHRRLHFKAGRSISGRVIRWVACTLLGGASLAASWIFLPHGSSFNQTIEHGELAAAALALAYASLDLSLGKETMTKWRTVGSLLSVILIAAAILLLAGIYGVAPNLPASVAEACSKWLGVSAVLVGAITIAFGFDGERVR